MLRILTVGLWAMVAVLLFSGDASAFGKRRSSCNTATTSSCGTSYGGCGTVSGGCGAVYGDSGAVYGGGYGAGYGGGYGYGAGYGGGYGYNPGGLGGPRSGLGVRPGAGFGGFGLRR